MSFSRRIRQTLKANLINLGLALVFGTSALADLPPDLEAPESVQVGMTSAQATATLLARGFERTTLCIFEKRDSTHPYPHMAAKVQVTLTMEPDPRAEIKHDSNKAMMQVNCDYDDKHRVSKIKWMEWTGRGAADRTLDVDAEVSALVAEYGALKSCQIETPTERRWCRWPDALGAEKLSDLTISISANGTRAVEATADSVRLWSDSAEDKTELAANAAEATAFCETYNQGQMIEDRMRALRDCQCVGERLAQALANGLVDGIDLNSLNKVILDNPLGCAQDADTVKAWYQGRCEETHGYGDGKAWSQSGGCACVAEQTTSRFVASPVFRTTISGSDLEACDFANRATYAERARTDAMAGLSAVPPGLRPFEYWEHEGRLTVLNPANAADNTRPFQRYLNLIFLRTYPELIDEDVALQILAAENITDSERDRYLSDCYLSNPEYCVWAGSDETARSAIRKEFQSGLAAEVQELAAHAPDTFTIVETLSLASYDADKGGANIIGIPGVINNDASYFNIIGYLHLTRQQILAKRLRDIPYPSFWQLSAAEAERIFSQVKVAGSPPYQTGAIYIAWTYRIVRVEIEKDRFSERQLVTLDPVHAKIYADENLQVELAAFTPTEDGIIRAGSY